MKAVSARRSRENRERRKVLRQMADAHDGVCPRCFSEPVVDGHEVVSRARGGSITDSNNILLVGRKCHDWITTHPAQAEAQGWAATRRTR